MEQGEQIIPTKPELKQPGNEEDMRAMIAENQRQEGLRELEAEKRQLQQEEQAPVRQEVKPVGRPLGENLTITFNVTEVEKILTVIENNEGFKLAKTIEVNNTLTEIHKAMLEWYLKRQKQL